MEIEKQVCSLEPAKRLKDLGVEQKSYFHWRLRKEWYVTEENDEELWATAPLVDECSAFTVAELGEMLPVAITLKDEEVYLQHWLNGERSLWSSAYKTFDHKATIAHEFSETEADARASMLIYLLENRLIQS